MKKQLDLFASGVVRTHEGYEAWAVDIVPHPENPNMRQADLALEPIPFPDNSFDLVTVYDGLEHIPFNLYINGKRKHVMFDLFAEIYRVMEPDAEFYSQTPIFPSRVAFQDPDHMSVWTEETFNYFSGDYFGFHDHHDLKFDFIQLQKHVENDHIYITLKAIKPMRKEFTL